MSVTIFLLNALLFLICDRPNDLYTVYVGFYYVLQSHVVYYYIFFCLSVCLSVCFIWTCVV